MKTNLKRKNYYLDENKIRRVRTILGVKTETEAIEVHVCPVRFLRELEFTIERGDKLAVMGSRTAGHALIVAREIRKGQDSLVVRDLKGAPNWLPR